MSFCPSRDFSGSGGSWGAMLALSRKDIINDAVGIFTDAAQRIGRKATEKLEMECFAALLSDRDKLFLTT